MTNAAMTIPTSPMTFMTNALRAARTALVLSVQNPISRYEANPTRAQPTIRKKKSAAATRSSMAKTNRFKYAKKRTYSGSPSMYPRE